MVLFESDAVVYSISEISNAAREAKGVQSSSGFGGGGVGGVPGGRNSPLRAHGFPLGGQDQSVQMVNWTYRQMWDDRHAGSHHKVP